SRRAHLRVGLHVSHPLRWFPKRPCDDRCNRRAREVTPKLPLRASTPKILASSDFFGVVRHGESVPPYGGRIDVSPLMMNSRLPSFRCQRAFENNLKNPGEPFFRHHSKLLH